MARACCLVILALVAALAYAPDQAPAKKRSTATAKRCTVKKAPRPRACRARSWSTWRLLAGPRIKESLTDLNPRGATAPTGTPPVSAPGTGTGPAYSRFVSATTRDTPVLSLALSRPIVGTGRITVQLQNRGEDPHNLKLSTGPGQPPLTAIADTDPGGVAEMSPTLGAGSYYLYCSLGDHESRGMHATLEVR